MRALQRIHTSGKDNNCLVHALATWLIAHYHTQGVHCYERDYLKARCEEKGALDEKDEKEEKGFAALKAVYTALNKKQDNIFGDPDTDDMRKQIEKLGSALRQYGASLMMDDVKKSANQQADDLQDAPRQHGETLKQALLAAFEDYCGKSKDGFQDDTFKGMTFVQAKFDFLLEGQSTLTDKQLEKKKEELGRWWDKTYFH